MGKVVITLTTVPERLTFEPEDGFKLCLKSLCEQNHGEYEIHLNLPHTYNVTKQEYVIPQWLEDYQTKYPHLKIFRMEDMGPPTKVVPTIQRESGDTLMIIVDDDLVYHPDMIIEHLKYHSKLENAVVLYDGRSLVPPKWGDLRDSWVLTVSEISRVKELQQKIKMFVVPYEPEIEKVSTYQGWYENQGVTTFPVLRHTNGLMQTGCNHPDTLKVQPKFFIPEDFRKIDYTFE